MKKATDFVRMQIKDTYSSIASRFDGLFKDNGSRFIAQAYPVGSEEQVKDIVDRIKKEYHDARHHCYAYRIGLDGSVWRANDDGEPSGSAGRPILGQIDSAGLSDVLVVVIRYFGGIKLGIPGLIRAYRTSTADALANATVVEKVAGNDYKVTFPYLSMNSVMKVAKDLSLPQRDQSFAEECSMVLRVRLSQEADFLERISGIDGLDVVRVQT
ncbi:MAG: YigZ family protein [Bacteroidales bacterium]|nr:YigZ family protein [Bacteroidales bacterium]